LTTVNIANVILLK